MNTILKICEAFKGFGDYITSNAEVRAAYIDLLVLIGIGCIGSIALTLLERRT